MLGLRLMAKKGLDAYTKAKILIVMPLVTPPIKNISEVTEPLKEQILKGDVHTIDEMRA